MSCQAACHEWRVAPYEHAAAGCHDTRSFGIHAHRNRRGPFSAAGGLVRAIAGDAVRIAPDLIATHLVTLLLVAPELGKHIDVPANVLQAASVSREGDPPAWLRRVSNGVVDFVLGYFGVRRLPAQITIFDVDEADPADLDVIAVLLRRADPQTLRLTICTRSDHLYQPLAAFLEKPVARDLEPAMSQVPVVWTEWFAACCLDEAAAGALWRELKTLGCEFALPPDLNSLEPFYDECLGKLSAIQRTALARKYVGSDGTSRHRLAWHAWRRLGEPERKAMHMARADALIELDEPSLLVGAIPFHREQAGEGADALLTASRLCLEMACYDAALDWSVRGRKMLSHEPIGKTYSDLTRNMLFALLLLGRYGEVVHLCDQILAAGQDAALQAHASYAMAILNARLYDRSRHDYDCARIWVEKAQTFMQSLPVSPKRAVNDAFFMNTLALVEMRKGNHAVAEQKLIDAIALLARAAPNLYPTQSVILLHNLARLHLSTGHADLAIDDLNALLSQLPSDSDAWFDRGLIHQGAGRHEASLADFEKAIRWEPAHVDAHFHRAQALVALHDIDEAIAAFGRVIILQPDSFDALLNRAALLRDRGELSQASEDVVEALRHRPGDARALCLRGLIEMKAGRLDAAFDTFSRSIAGDPYLANSWANRAAIAVRFGDLDAALNDLTKALSLREDPVILRNRAKVFQKQRKWQKAADDYSRALAIDRTV